MADDAHERLFRLSRKHFGPENLELVPALNNFAQWKLGLFHGKLRGGIAGPAPVSRPAGAGSPTEPEAHRQAFESLTVAQQAFLEAIDLLVKNRQYQDPRLQRLEEGLVETFFLQAYRDNLSKDPVNYLASRRLAADSLVRKPGIPEHSRRFRDGEDAYIRMLSYLKLDPEATIEQFGARLVDLGDWYMLFGHRSAAVAKYQQAYRLWTSSGVPEEKITGIFRPDVPVQLPTFTPTPHSAAMFQEAAAPSGHEPSTTGYVDLKFTLNELGRASAIETLDDSAQTSDAIRSRLIWMVRDAQFRPVFENGVQVERFDVRARYYYRHPPPAER